MTRLTSLGLVAAVTVVGTPPTIVSGGSPSAAHTLAGGAEHSLVVKSDGTLWSFGSNAYGQLGPVGGVGLFSGGIAPSEVMSDVVEVAAGGNHSMAVKADGSLWTMGHGGLGPYIGDPTPVRVMTGVAHSAAWSSH